METSAGFWLLAVLLLVGFTQAQTVEKYFKVGGTLQLSPQPVSGAITSIVWKYDKMLLAEWVKGSIDLTYYSKFKGRTNLNTDTGVLEIRDMTATDTGLYSVEINNQVQSRLYQTVEVEAVPQPEVILQPLACDRSSTCGLKCYGDITNAGPVTYSWKKDGGEWEDGQDRRDLSKLEKDSVKTFTCRMKNPVSQKESEAFKNPFHQRKPANSDDLHCGLWVITLGAVMRSLAILALFVVVVYFLCQKLQTGCKCRKSDDDDDDAV
ncbi:SLAM family member 9-like isoform X1 [Oreochromis aureus]|nr:SLAM family member 9-like isoform X1 [Oreochromis aureus]